MLIIVPKHEGKVNKSERAMKPATVCFRPAPPDPVFGVLWSFVCLQVKEKPSHRSEVETEEKSRGAEKPTNHSFPLFPPFPPPPPLGSGVKLTLIFIRLIISDIISSVDHSDTASPSPGRCVLHPSSSSSSLDVWWERVRQRRRHLQHVDAVVHVWLPHRQLHGQ